MRLFTGIPLPEQIKRNLEELLRRIRPAARIKWSTAANLHITTKFVGEWPDSRLDEIRGALGALPRSGEIPIAIRGLGWFPNPRAPRVFWAGVEAPPALAGLARATEDALAVLGVPVERRPFSPHLTLARIREPIPLDNLFRAVGGLASDEFGSFTAASFHLYQSELRPSGSVYTSLDEFRLGDP
jgi:2'-5' RNA ligase